MTKKGEGRRLCAAALLTFILSAGLFLSACGGGGSSGSPMPGPGNGNGNPDNGNPDNDNPDNGNPDNGNPPPPPAVTVSFGEASYSITEGEAATVTVTLSADPERTVEIPVTVDMTSSTAAIDDYSLQSAGVTFASGETTNSITLTTTDDTAYGDSEDVVLVFGTLPERVSEGTTPSTTVTIENNDPPDSCDDDGVISVTGDYDATTADPDPQGEGLFICGNTMDNVIRGGDGDDTIWGGRGNDRLQGRGGDDTLDGGPGEDTVVYWVVDEDDATGLEEGLDVSLAYEEPTSDGRGGTDTLTGIENVECRGQQGDNPSVYVKIAGNSGNNRIDCKGSRKSILIGGGGNDRFIRHSVGEDYYDGGPGTDTLDYSGVDLTNLGTLKIALNLIENGEHQDFEDNGHYGRIGTNVGGSSGATFEGYARLAGNNSMMGQGRTNVENIIGTKFSDDLTGHGGNNRIEGRGGDDTLHGGDGDDELIGGGGADTLNGGEGNDILRGEGGSDTLRGGPGDDTYYATSSETGNITDSGGSADVLHYTDSAAIAHGHTYAERNNGNTPANVETVYGTIRNDRIRAISRQNNEYTIRLVGGPGNDSLYGGSGKDILVGCYGRNTYYSRTTTCSDGLCGWAEQDDQGNDFVITVSGEGHDIIEHFFQDDTLYLMDYAGDHDALTIIKETNKSIFIKIANSSRTIVVRTTPSEVDGLVSQFNNSASGRIVIRDTLPAGCDLIN